MQRQINTPKSSFWLKFEVFLSQTKEFTTAIYPD